MKKAVYQGLLTVILFFAILLVLNQVNWMSILNIEQVSKSIDEELGELYWEIFRESEEEIKDVTITSILDSILTEICNSNYIDKNKFKIHLLHKDEVNAFALPDGHIVIYSGLLLASENEAEFSGVLCHEIAHIELDHVMEKLIKEVGLSAILSITTGSNGSDVLSETAKILSSSAFDRKLEREADVEAVNLLIKSKIDPEAFALFLFRLKNSTLENKFEGLAWINTHPKIEDRVKNIVKQCNESGSTYKSILENEKWGKLQELLKSY